MPERLVAAPTHLRCAADMVVAWHSIGWPLVMFTGTVYGLGPGATSTSARAVETYSGEWEPGLERVMVGGPPQHVTTTTRVTHW